MHLDLIFSLLPSSLIDMDSFSLLMAKRALPKKAWSNSLKTGGCDPPVKPRAQPGVSLCPSGAGLSRPAYSRPASVRTTPHVAPTAAANVNVALPTPPHMPQHNPGLSGAGRGNNWLAPSSNMQHVAEAEMVTRWVSKWVSLVLPLCAFSSVYCEIHANVPLCKDMLHRQFSRYSSRTLRRHWNSWQSYLDVMNLAEVAAKPSLMQLLDFLSISAAGAAMDRLASAPAGSAVPSLRWIAELLNLDGLLRLLSSSLIISWSTPSVKAMVKEAVPLPLWAVANLEYSLHKLLVDHPNPCEMSGQVLLDFIGLIAWLLMLWSSLRFSDLQRIVVNEFDVDALVARSFCFRTNQGARACILV